MGAGAPARTKNGGSDVYGAVAAVCEYSRAVGGAGEGVFGGQLSDGRTIKH